MIKISDDFPIVDLATWQEVASKSLKLESYEALENKLNKQTCEGLILKSYYSREVEDITLATYPKIRSLVKFIDSKNELDDSIDKIYSFTDLKQNYITSHPNNESQILDYYSLFESCEYDVDKFSKKLQTLTFDKCIIRTDLVHNAGGSMIQELAFTLGVLENISRELSDITVYVELAIDSLYFCNISKLRALRYLVESLNSQLNYPLVKILAVPSKREQTLYDPWVNMLRQTTSVSAAFLGGADEIAVENFDRLLSDLTNKSSEDVAARQARNIYHILNEESFLARVIDPARGSYAIEALTQELIHFSFELYKSYGNESLLGQIKKFSHQVEQIALERKKRVSLLEHVIAGVNNFANTEDKVDEILSLKESPLFPLRRSAEEFELLRQKLESKDLKIKLFVCGAEAKLSARIMFCANYFEVLGHRVETLFVSHKDTIQEGDINLYCALDDDYESWLNELKPSLQSKHYIAGTKYKREGYLNIYQGQNRLEILSQATEGIIS